MKAGWEVKPLGEIIEKLETVDPRKAPKTEFEYVDVSSVSKETFAIEETTTLIGSKAPSRARRKIRTHDVIFATIRPTLRRIAYVPAHLDQAICSTGYMVLRPKPSILPKFLFYYLFSAEYSEAMESLQKGASYPAVTDGEVRQQPIPLPPLDEQKRIVAVLDAAFDGLTRARANVEANLQNARELFESYLEKFGHEKKPLGGFVKIRTGKLNANAAVAGGQYPFFTCSRNIFEIDHFAFDCEAILLAGNNASGDFNVKHFKGKFNAYQRTYIIEIESSDLMNYRYLYFQMIKSLKVLKRNSVGANTKFLKLDMIKDLMISVPNVNEQIMIVSTLDRLKKETITLETLYQTKLTDLDELRQSLLQKAFAGALT